MSQAVMAAITASRLQTEVAQGQGHLVAHHQQTALVDVLVVQPVAHGIATEIHIGRRLQQKHLAPFQRGLSHEAIASVCKRNIGRLRKSVQYHESCIVAGQFVLVADIAQTYNQELVHQQP